ncbi:MAG: addiction module antidote protein [Pseudomonadota bacterium]
MNIKHGAVPYKPEDYLKTTEDITEYLNAAIEDGDERVLLMALRNVVNATGGMTKLSRQTGLSRESLYRLLSEGGNPRLSSLVAVLQSFGLSLAVRRDPQQHMPVHG